MNNKKVIGYGLGAAVLFAVGIILLGIQKEPVLVYSATTCQGSPEADPVTTPVYGQYDGTTRITEDIWYGSPEGSDQYFNLYLPAVDSGAPTPYPVVVWVKGGNFLNTDPDLVEIFYRAFTSEGYAVASMVHRTRNETVFPGQVQDIKAFLHYLQAHKDQYGLDTDKIAMVGSSSGGIISAIAAFTSSTQYAPGYSDYRNFDTAAVDALVLLNAGVASTGLDCYENGGELACTTANGNTLPIMMEYVGCDNTDFDYTTDDPVTYCPELSRAMPDLYVDGNDTLPVLILHGAQDTTVPSASNIATATALTVAGLDVSRCEVDIVSNGGNVPDVDINDTGHTQRVLLWEKDTVFDFLDTALN